MNIDHEMEHRFGPKGVVLPHEGARYRLSQEGVSAQVKLAPGQYPHYKFSVVRYDLEPGAEIDLHATLFAGRILFCLEGDGGVTLNGIRKPFSEGAFVHLGEGHHATLCNTGTITQQIFSFVFGPSIETRLDLMSAGPDGLLHLDLTPDLRNIHGLLTLDEARTLSEVLKGELIYQLPDEGRSFWQAKPSAGFVEIKMAPFTSNVHHYGVLMQTLFPGNAVREHAHNQLNEFFVISKGTAWATLDGVKADCPKGTVIIIGRNVFHSWGNAGNMDVQNFAIIDPPGVEGALSLTGRPRTPGQEWPSDIVRNTETGRILHDRFGFVIRGDAADRF
ncbi:cupin domain-containing protein [Rhizobium sp. 11515TR]|uniref:cupin domain-containing protein n=1 Tax=Rhizobium sp. 11515TR TaxID=2028343 RepID=UPI000BA8CA41|nr:cupin domain-containing protein [Rhizobium sp. 11515TR]ASW09896.1 hypothetical protein CKA34_28150 [Rhizobium sp. 11515TR]